MFKFENCSSFKTVHVLKNVQILKKCFGFENCSSFKKYFRFENCSVLNLFRLKIIQIWTKKGKKTVFFYWAAASGGPCGSHRLRALYRSFPIYVSCFRRLVLGSLGWAGHALVGFNIALPQLELREINRCLLSLYSFFPMLMYHICFVLC